MKMKSIKYEQRLKEFMCSQYTGNLIKKFGFDIIAGISEGDYIEKCLDKYSNDNLFEMEIVNEVHRKGFITEKERKELAHCF